MNPNDLTYPSLLKTIRVHTLKGYTEGKAFLAWFLENISRLDEITAADAICDSTNDKGIDAIYVDHLNEEIHFIQSRTAQRSNKTVGDVSLKTFYGTLAQFNSSESIDDIVSGDASSDLKNLLVRQQVGSLLDKGYQVLGVYLTNQSANAASQEYLQHAPELYLYDRNRIAKEYIDLDASEGVEDKFKFDVDYAGIIEMNIATEAKVYMFPAQAIELVRLKGISDASLFKRNVRYSLGNTSVNKAIAESVKTKAEHKYFPLFHNGVTIICDSAKIDGDQLKIENYVVVNGAQSLSTFYANDKKLTSDLRVFVRVIALTDDALSRKITLNSNNQNAIKPKDLRSNHDIMLRLSKEFKRKELNYNFEIKRGERFEDDRPIITNDEAGRILLAFDLGRPYACHQIYKVFDELYAEVFGRPEVTAHRIEFIKQVADIIDENNSEITNRPLANYALTRYFILAVIRDVMDKNEKTKKAVRAPEKLEGGERKEFFDLLYSLVGEMVVDFNHLIDEQPEDFDYKRDLKSPEKTKTWRGELLRTYDKDLKRGKATNLADALK